jgi:hypothetical protein
VSSRRVALLLALFLVVAFGPFVAPLSSQPASRIALTAALVEHHTVDIRGYPLGIDRAHYDGELRSDKAPGQPLLAVPVYEAGKALGAQSESHRRVQGNLGLWWVTFWTSFLPFVALVVLMFLVASRYTPPIPALGAALGLGVCSMLLPHSVNLYGAALAALTAYAAWALLDAGPFTSGRLVAAGTLAAVGVVTEYETGIIALVLALFVIRAVRGRVAWFALGAAAPALVAGLYQTAAFGRPWRTAHAYYATAAIREQIVGYELKWRGVTSTFVGTHGLLLTNSIVLVGLAAAILVARSPRRVVARNATVAVAVSALYLALCIVWKGTHALEEPGPRYMIPAIPFLAVPLAAAWSRLRRVALVAMGLSTVVAVGAATTNLLVAHQLQVFPEMLRRMLHGRFSPTLWSMGLGWPGVLLYLVTVGCAGWALLAAVQEPARPEIRTEALAGADR